MVELDNEEWTPDDRRKVNEIRAYIKRMGRLWLRPGDYQMMTRLYDQLRERGIDPQAHRLPQTPEDLAIRLGMPEVKPHEFWRTIEQRLHAWADGLPQSPARFISTTDAAKLKGCSAKTIRDAARRGAFDKVGDQIDANDPRFQRWQPDRSKARDPKKASQIADRIAQVKSARRPRMTVWTCVGCDECVPAMEKPTRCAKCGGGTFQR